MCNPVRVSRFFRPPRRSRETLTARAAAFALLAAAAAAPLAAQSSRFTNPTVPGASNPLFTLESLSPEFSLMAENGEAALYLNRRTLGIRVLNKKTGYLWSSDVEDFGDDWVNDHWKAFIASGVTIEYYLERTNSAGRVTVDRRATEESFLDSEFSTAKITPVSGGFRVEAVFGISGIGVVYETVLSGGSVEVRCDSAGVTETATERIVSVQFYPFLGSVRYGSQGGYFVLPDGDGSLVRFDNVYRTITKNYQKRYFGDDAGISPATEENDFLKESQSLTFNVYGIVHGVGSDGLMCEIASGALFAELLLYPAGVRTNFYFISNRYLLRQPYMYIVSSGNETTMITPDRASFVIRERYTLLSGEEASYVGVAQAYRASLVGQGLLLPGAAGSAGGTAAEKTPVFINGWAGAANQGILSNSNIVMTSIADLAGILDNLAAAGVESFRVHYGNEFKNVFTGTERDRYTLRPGLGTLGKLRDLAESLAAAGSRLLVDTNLEAVMSKTAGLDLHEDVIRGLNKRYAVSVYSFGAVTRTYHHLNAGGIHKVLEQDIEEMGKKGFDSFVFSMGLPASSFNEEKTTWREEAAGEITAAFAAARERGASYIALERGTALPAYFSSIDALTGVTMETALFPYVTDTIPFTSLVLRGSLELFSGNLNDAADPEEYLLRLIEWGLYPACLLTREDANLLLYSDTTWIQSSRYEDWKPELLRVYAAVNEALTPAGRSAIAGHEAVTEGVMKTTYENGAVVFVNYNSRSWSGDGVTVPARGYKTVTGR